MLSIHTWTQFPVCRCDAKQQQRDRTCAMTEHFTNESECIGSGIYINQMHQVSYEVCVCVCPIIMWNILNVDAVKFNRFAVETHIELKQFRYLQKNRNRHTSRTIEWSAWCMCWNISVALVWLLLLFARHVICPMCDHHMSKCPHVQICVCLCVCVHSRMSTNSNWERTCAMFDVDVCCSVNTYLSNRFYFVLKLINICWLFRLISLIHTGTCSSVERVMYGL